jgi:type II pantothenate kinase
VLAANNRPTINDITAGELQPLLAAAAADDATLGAAVASGRLAVVSSGSDMPVIDVSRVRSRGRDWLGPRLCVVASSPRKPLAVLHMRGPRSDLSDACFSLPRCCWRLLLRQQVSPALAGAAAGADLLVFEGMGRGIETNLRASFKCDSLKLGMIKHPEVAACLAGGRLYDCVCKFDRAGTDAGRLRLARADPAAAAAWN